jgi:hypothetical protein
MGASRGSVVPVRKTGRVLSLFLVASRTADRERGELLVDRLAVHRPVLGFAPQWQVVYECGDATEAMGRCAAELSELDPGWVEILDFEVLRPDPDRRAAVAR